MPAIRPLLLSPALSLAVCLAAAFAAGPALAASGDTTADRVLGQPDLTSSLPNRVDARGLGGPLGVAIDTSVVPNRVYVADGFNHRVLGWRNEAALRNGAPADLVIGQPDFESYLCHGGGGPTASTLCSVTQLAVDGAGNLYVADPESNRVLEYDSPFTTDAVADRVFGQGGSFTGTDDCFLSDFETPDYFCHPWGVAVDHAGGLYIADPINNCRLLYYATPLVAGTVPRILRSPDGCGLGTGFTDPLFLTVDAAGNLWVTDTTGVYEFDRPLATDLLPDRIFGLTTLACAPGVDDLCRPAMVAIDGAGTVYLADTGNNRVLVYDAPLATDIVPDRVIGQPDFASTACNAGGLSAQSLCGPWGLALDGDGDLWVAEESNNRVLEIPSPGTGTAARRVLGQVRFDENGVDMVDPAGLFIPTGVAIDKSVSPNRLWVADALNHRVLGWRDVSSLRSGQPADVVVGQPGFFRSGCNTGGRSARSLCASESPGASDYLRLAVDRRGNLWVTDPGNNRVLGYDDPFATDTVADRVIGQRGFAAGECNAGGLSAASLCRPADVALDHRGDLYIADAGNNRVLRFDAPPARDAVADTVWGQHGSFTTGDCNRGGVSARSLCVPVGVEIDGAGRLYVVDFNGRLLGFRDARSGDDTADLVLGGSFTRSTCNSGGISARTLCTPTAVTAGPDGDLYVVDSGNNRVLRFDAPWRRFRATRVFGQGGSFTSDQIFRGGITADSLGSPFDAAVDEEGDLYVVDAIASRVLIYEAP